MHFTLGSVSPDSANGINRVIEGAARTSNLRGKARVSVLTVRARRRQFSDREFFQREGFTVVACRSTAEAIRYLKENHNNFDLVHMHNAWSVPNVLLGRCLRELGIPYVVTPHAAFLPDRMQRRRMLKAAFHWLFQRRFLDAAAAIVAVSREEISSIASFTLNERIEFVPNGSDMPLPEMLQTRPTAVLGAPLKFGYIGRISREKNILALVQAVALLTPNVRDKMRVIIYGDDTSVYARRCLALVKKERLETRISFAGPLKAVEKSQRLLELDVYIQPSLSEAASISVLEAISHSLPLIAARTAGVAYWQGQPFLEMVEPVASDIAKGIERVVKKHRHLISDGEEAFAYFERNFQWSNVIESLETLYSSVLERNARNSDMKGRHNYFGLRFTNH